MQSPKLRNVEKYKSLYPLNKLPKSFGNKLGKEIIYLLASRGQPRLEGSDWEEIFARIVGAEWKPSNVGLDDIAFEQTAWGAKTVKNRNPFSVKKIRLISGRNSPVYSFGDKKVSQVEPKILGEKIVSIWNERVASIRKFYKNLRTVVLIKSDDLLELSVFEFDTVMINHENYWWQWNSRNNLEGYLTSTNEHGITWQPHGSQFTLIENVPESRLKIRIKQPPIITQGSVLEAINFDESWIEIM
jgi:hypothetical protein